MLFLSILSLGCTTKQETTPPSIPIESTPEISPSKLEVNEPNTPSMTKSTWTMTSLTPEAIQQELDISLSTDVDGITIQIADTDQMFYSFEFNRIDNGDAQYYLVTGSGTGGPNIRMYHTLLIPPNTIIGQTTSLVHPQILNDDTLTLSFGYVNGIEQVVQIKDDSWMTIENPTTNTRFELPNRICKYLYELSDSCREGDVGSLLDTPGCPTNHDDFVLGGEYMRTYELASAHSTFNAQKHRAYCIALCNGSPQISQEQYQLNICGLEL